MSPNPEELARQLRDVDGWNQPECIDQAATLIEQQAALIVELANELEGELRARYDRMLDLPGMKRRFDRDMETVRRACTLSKLTPNGAA